MQNNTPLNAVDLLLRIGVAFAFLYPPISALFNPYAWVGYFPVFISSIEGIDALMLLHIFGVFEVMLGLWILSGRRILLPSVAASISLFLIVAFNWTQMDVLFRDLPILLMAVALVLLHRK